MSGSDEWTLVLAAVANAAGIAVALVMWRRHRRRRRALESNHPSVRPPLGVDLVDTDGARRIRLSVPPGAPTLSIDIVSFRRDDESHPWESELLEETLVIPPGSGIVLASQLATDTSSVDVVVAWTAHSEAGATPGSQLFRVPEQPDVPVAPPPAAGLAGPVAIVLVAILVGSVALVGLSALGDDAAGDSSDAAPTFPTAPTTGGTDVASTTVAGGTGAVPTSVEPPATSDPSAPSVVTTTAPAAPTTPPGTGAPDTSAPATSVPTGGGPVVLAEGRIEPCRFGDECLVVGFRISGFDGTSGDYVCEFEDGSRFTFSFLGDGAETACATGSETAEITVEVDGVRSETVTRP